MDDDIPLAQFAVAFEGAAWTDPDSVALMVMQAMLGSWNKSTGGGKHMGYNTWALFQSQDKKDKKKLGALLPHDRITELNFTCYSSALAQRVGINEVAESMMAFNTNYKDTGLFGVYAVAKVSQCVDSEIHNAFVSFQAVFLKNIMHKLYGKYTFFCNLWVYDNLYIFI